jgi:hypothetical protein
VWNEKQQKIPFDFAQIGLSGDDNGKSKGKSEDNGASVAG